MSRMYPQTFRTIEGHPVERNIRDYPYSYTRFLLWKGPNFSVYDHIVYSDRLRREEGAHDAWNKILGQGQYMGGKSPEDVEKWLQVCLNNPSIELTGVEQECNCSNGYPYYILYFKM